MLIWLLRFIRGTLIFRVEGKYIERFLNLAARAKIPVWSVQREDYTFQGTTLLANEEALKQIAEKVQLHWSCEQKVGAPKIHHKYRKRLGICIGIILAVVSMILSQQFIWGIDVKGVSTVNTDEIVAAANRQGLTLGSWKHNLDVIKIADQITVQFPEVSWAAVNLIGTVAEIEIVERVEPPLLIDEDTPCNVISTRSGRIVEIEVFDGKRMVQIGDTIKEGSLISAGILQDRHGRTIYRHARAKAVVEYTTTETFEILLRSQEVAVAGNIENTYYLSLGNISIPLGINNFPSNGEFSTALGLVECGIYKNANGEQWFYSVRNRKITTLPVTLQIRQHIPAEVVTIERDAEQAKELALLKFIEYKRKLENDHIDIIDSELTGRIQNNRFILTAKLTCREDAAREIPIEFQEN